MQVSMKWLRDYIDIPEEMTAEELADKFTMAGVPVENVVRADEGLEKVVTGRIEKLVPHPDSDHLQICTMNVGGKEPVQIVTGARNVAEGQVVPVALVGAHLPTGQKISKGKLRGVPSNGMLCSAGELKLDLTDISEEEQNGIYILPSDTPVGVQAAKVLGLDDAVLEFELTANRGDCFSVWGLVREAAVLTGQEPHFPEIKVNEDDAAKTGEMVKIGIEADDLCSRFSARVINNVKIGPSPAWMQARLEGAGIRAINNVVDVTNFVMVELGQPMHAYDYDELAGHSLTARRAVKGENLHTLDDSSRLAQGEELVIADAAHPAGLAGIMGGLESEVTEKTKTVVFEAAAFYGPSIRRTARACGLHSEASGRFERGVDVTQTVRALDRACQLLQEMGACTVAQGVVDVYPAPQAEVTLEFAAEAVNKRLGTDLSGSRMTEILTKLGFGIEDRGQETYLAKVPSWRNDVTMMEDISEEIARIIGFDSIKATTPYGRMMQGVQGEKQDFITAVKYALCGLGMTEELSFSFTSESMLDKMNVPQDSPLRQAIPIMNPLTDDYPLVRTTLLTSIMENAVRNFARQNLDLRYFDIAPVFTPKALPLTELPEEKVKLVGLMTGRRQEAAWNASNDLVDFYDMKGLVEQLFRQISISKYQVESGEHYAMHPGKTAAFKKGREVIAMVGELHPQIMENFGIKQPVYIFEMDVETLMKYTAKSFKYESLPKYPAISRDLAMLVDSDVPAADIERVVARNGGKHFQGVTLFDVYTGKQVAEGKKSMAFNLRFQSKDKTLTDAEADEAFQNILQAVKKEFQAELRA